MLRTTLGVVICLLGYTTAASVNQTSSPNSLTSGRDGKFLSIFSVVRFPNSGCSASTLYNGTCLTSAECSQSGGTSYSSCASGFGVCCVFFIQSCGTTTNRNCTYFQNPGYPSNSNPPLQCSLTVQKCNTNICQLRLDFQVFVLAQPDSTAYTATGANYQGQCVTDSFTVSGASNPIPVLCGTNTGQHMYADMTSGSGSFTLSFSVGNGPSASTTSRTWSVKISQLPCDAISDAPPQCLQWYTSTTGTLTTFNYQTTTLSTTYQLSNHDYTICVRMAQGFCGICYSTCLGTTPPAFGVSGTAATATASTACLTDWIVVPQGYGQGTTKGIDRICGGLFVANSGDTTTYPICSTSKPFELRVHTDTNEGTTDIATGFCLNYNQIPCLTTAGTNKIS